MQNKLPRCFKYFFLLLPAICLFLVQGYAQVNFSTDYFGIHINSKGFITSMKNIGQTPRREFSPPDKPSPLLCLYNSNKKKYYEPQKATYSQRTGLLTLTYANGSVAQVAIETKAKYLK